MDEPLQIHHHTPEQQIWLAFQRGDEQAYSTLYTTYFSLLFRYGKKFTQEIELIEDCIQDLYVTLWKSREKIGLPESVKNYLFKSLRFAIFKKLKSKDEVGSDEIYLDEYSKEFSTSQETFLIQEIEESERKIKIEKALSNLPKRQREAIFLKFYNEMTYQEIADLMEISVQGVYNLISKSLLQLQKEFSLLLIISLGAANAGFF